MKYLFEDDGRKILETFCSANTLFAFDYDGTLAPLVNDPESGHMRSKTLDLLSGLRALSPVAIISGRAVKDVRRFLSGKFDFIIGNHGCEGLPSGDSSLTQAEEICKRWHAQLLAKIVMDGIIIEDKGYSLAVHYRMASDKNSAQSLIDGAARSLDPPARLIKGTYVVNFVTPSSPHKGMALNEVMLAAGCGKAIYIGDDDTDEDAFALAKDSILTVRVGKREESAARFYIRDQNEIDELLSLSTILLKNLIRR